MKQIFIIASLLLCHVLSVNADEVFLRSEGVPNRNIRIRFVADSDHVLKTPSWTVGEASPFDQEKLLALLHEKHPELKNESIYGIRIGRVPNMVKKDGTPLRFDRKWFYTVSWMKNDRLKTTIVLLDGTIIEPKEEPYK